MGEPVKTKFSTIHATVQTATQEFTVKQVTKRLPCSCALLWMQFSDELLEFPFYFIFLLHQFGTHNVDYGNWMDTNNLMK